MRNFSLLLFLSILISGLSTAQNASFSTILPDNYDPSTFEIPEGKKEGIHYASQRIQFKLKTGQENALNAGNPLAVYLQSIGAQYKKMFPQAQKPERTTDNYGRKYADLTRIYEADYTASVPVSEVMQTLKKFGVTDYVQPNFFVEHEGEDKINFTPNDPQIASQWHLNTIQAFNAWDVTQGDSTVIIGIPDGGTNLVHADLLNIAFNYGDPIDGVDNDGDGWLDNWQGWNTGSNNHITQFDFGGGSNHGIAVTGMASATVNNATNGAGIGFNCKYMPIKIVNASNQWSGAEPGVYYAAENGAKVINCSWGNTFPWPLVEDVLRYAAINKGCFIAASAGNNNNTAPFWPAAYEWTTGVAGTASTDVKSTNSSYYDVIDISAPGQSLFSTTNYTFGAIGGGTSFASPLVAGSAALIFSHYPTYVSDQTKALLKESAFNLYTIPANNAFAGKLGKGRLDIGNALNGTFGPSVTMASRNWSDGNDYIFSPGDTLTLSGNFVNWLNASSPALNCKIRTTNPFITLIDSVVTIGALNNLGMFNNAATPFRFSIGTGCPINTVVPFSLHFQDGAYTDVQHISILVNPSFLNVTENNLHTSVTATGRIGFADWAQTLGLGISKQGNLQHLKTSSLILTDSPTRVSDATINSTLTPSNNPVNNDFNALVNQYKTVPSEFADFEATGKFRDDNAGASALGVETTQKTYAWNSAGDENFVILEYTLKNTGASTLSNFYSGIYSYWEIPNAQFYYLQFASNWNAALKMGYAYNNTNPVGSFAGVKLLSYDSVSWYAFNNNGFNGSINLFDGFSDAEKFTAISNGVSRPSANPGTISGLLGTGPFTIPAGDSVKVAFALVIGDDYNELQQAAQAAQVKYDMFNAEWTGAVSTDWNDAGNWFPQQIPNSCVTNVYIPLTANQPEISGSDFTVRNLRADNGTQISISNGNTLSICKNVTAGNAAGLTVSGGKVILNGNATQTIEGNMTADFMSVENPSTVEIKPTGHLYLQEGIELQSGNVISNSNLTLKSDASGTAYLNDFSSGFTGTLQGNIHVQRYNAGALGFRQLGSPVNTTSIATVSGFSPAGSPGFIIPLPSCNPDQIEASSPYGNWMQLVENKPSVLYNCQQNLFEVITGGGMTNGRGYYMNTNGNSLITFTGEPNTGPVSFTATHANPIASNGWNMLSNPYPSPLQWELSDVPAGFDAIAQLWVTSGSYVGTFQPLDPNLPGIQSLAIGQGFQLRVSNPGGTANFVVNNQNRIVTPPTFLLDFPEANAIEIDVLANGFADKTKVRLRPDATNQYDGLFDSYKVAGKSNQPMLYSLMTGSKMSINSLQESSNPLIIPLGLKTGNTGSFTFEFSGASGFTENRLVYFEDVENNVFQNLAAIDTYTVLLNNGTYENRFFIHLLPPVIPEVVASTCEMDGSLSLNATLPGNWNYNVTDEINQTVSTGVYSAPLSINNLETGNYLIYLTETSTGYQLQIPVTVNGISSFMVEAFASENNVLIGENISFTASVLPQTNYTWNFGDGNSAPAANVTHAFLMPGNFDVMLTAQNDNCTTTDTVQIVVTDNSGITGNDDTDGITIWSSGSLLHTVFSYHADENAAIKMIDAQGKLVLEKQIPQSKNTVITDISHLSSGVYFVTVISNKAVISRKIVVAKP